MTAFNPATDLPADIDSVEKLVAWGNTVLSYLYKDLNIQEASNRVSRAIDSQPFEVTATDPVTPRLISRTSIELSREWQLGGGVWTSALPLGDASIPEQFKQG